MWYSKLSNKRLWQAFNEISRIPRESGNEEGIRNYLLSWAEKLFEFFSDNPNSFRTGNRTEGIAVRWICQTL